MAQWMSVRVRSIVWFSRMMSSYKESRWRDKMEKSSLHTLTALDCDKSMPLYRQVYQRFICAIKQDIFASGQRVPSIRALASELRISGNTVEVAYDLLIGEVHLEAQVQAGTIVTPVSPYLRNAMTHRIQDRELNVINILATKGTDSLYEP